MTGFLLYRTQSKPLVNLFLRINASVRAFFRSGCIPGIGEQSVRNIPDAIKHPKLERDARFFRRGITLFRSHEALRNHWL
jgi:hypothetical protein